MSREIDKQVAEALGYAEPFEAFRWHDRKNKKTPIVLFRVAPRGSFQSYDSHVLGDGTKVKYGTVFSYPNYSTNIAHAIAALEEFCKTRKAEWKIIGYENGGVGVFIDGTDAYDDKSITAAICNAILAAHHGRKA